MRKSAAELLREAEEYVDSESRNGRLARTFANGLISKLETVARMVDKETAEGTPRCLECGAVAFEPTAGCCHECGAEDRWIGSQWLLVPAELRPF